MFKRLLPALLAVMIIALATACAPTSEPVSGEGALPPDSSGAAGSRLAPGLYDLDDGTAQALGTLEYQDLEGGLWAIVGGTAEQGNIGTVVAVVANPDEFADELRSLEGKTVIITGTRFEGASIRMAGPEIVVQSIEEVSDTSGPAE